mmetsp:Transcript_54034/g.135870  ORF Transcript_54034/g.135870 Transcript_54034/m.135870 type:complete len:110 (-) Transcript_54034:1786-2115(-)
MILSARVTDDSLWAMVREVRPSATFMSESTISLSVKASMADVTSSHKRIGGSFRIARAIVMRCFSPPERDAPLCPMVVLRPSGSFSRVRERPAWMADSYTFSSSAFRSP